MTEPATPEAALQQAQKSIQSGDFQTASKITSEVLAQHPQHRDALYIKTAMMTRSPALQTSNWFRRTMAVPGRKKAIFAASWAIEPVR